jgi:hypothetical protein
LIVKFCEVLQCFTILYLIEMTESMTCLYIYIYKSLSYQLYNIVIKFSLTL